MGDMGFPPDHLTVTETIMTIQVLGTIFGKSKKVLQDGLNTRPDLVWFYDPSIFPGSRGTFPSNEMKLGESFPVVMDHPKRRRFAIVERRGLDNFKVS